MHSHKCYCMFQKTITDQHDINLNKLAHIYYNEPFLKNDIKFGFSFILSMNYSEPK